MDAPIAPHDPRKEAALWRVLFGIAVAACAVIYGVNVLLWEVDPGNWWGLSYGTAAMILMIGVWLLGVRRRTMSAASAWRLGRARTWLQFHIYAGIVAMILVLMHTKFRMPQGALNLGLYWLSVVTVASGLFGLFLQKWVPRMLSSGLAVEAHYDRIPELVEAIREEARELAEKAPESVRSLYESEMERELQRPKRRAIYFVDVGGGIQSRLREFAYLGRFYSGAERKQLDELAQLYRTKLEIDAHYTLQNALRIWLFSHVPTSLFLLALLVLHLFAVYYW